MLVVMRDVDESVKIGPDVCVRLLGVAGKRAKLGIEAPRDVLVLRSELGQTEGTAQVDHAKYALELLHCLRLLLGCTHDPSSERRVDLRGIPKGWISQAYLVIDNYESAMGLPTIEEVRQGIADREGAST
jgi:carbon storage regulator CsrA